MEAYVEGLEREFSAIERGFRAEASRARADYDSFDSDTAARVAYLAYGSEVYQVRMYAVFLLGYLSQDPQVLAFLRDEVSEDTNWRVQEVLAKAIDESCAVKGYERAQGRHGRSEDMDQSTVLSRQSTRGYSEARGPALRCERICSKVGGKRAAGHQQEIPGADRSRTGDVEPGD